MQLGLGGEGGTKLDIKMKDLRRFDVLPRPLNKDKIRELKDLSDNTMYEVLEDMWI